MYTWITQALNAGGKLTVEQSIPNKSIFHATMTWPVLSECIDSGHHLGLQTTLEALEISLQNDAANQMINSGAV